MTPIIFGIVVFLAFFGFWGSVPNDPDRPFSLLNCVSATIGSGAAGIAAGMFWALLDAPVVWP